MKCLITFCFEGKVAEGTVENFEDFRLVIKVNGREERFGDQFGDQVTKGKISRLITVYDPHPEWYECFVDIALYKITKSSLTRKIEEKPIGSPVKYSLKRRLNQKSTFFPKHEFFSGELLKHIQVEISCAEFTIPECNPILGCSSLYVVPYPGTHLGPQHLSMYFEEFNLNQVISAKRENNPWVILLEIDHAIPFRCVYYRSQLVKSDQFPKLPGALEVNAAEADTEDWAEFDSKEAQQAAPIPDLISF